MYSPKELEEFFTTNLPLMKEVIEEQWASNRADAIDFLRECTESGFIDTWMHPYFYDLYSLSCHADHKYTNPWEVL